MDFKQLEAFAAVVKQQNFSRAAVELFLTQPTVSAHIKSLESELGVTLVNRGPKQITLTPAGALLFNFATDLINRRDQAVFSIGQLSDTLQGVLEISASTIPEQYFLPEILVGFSQEYPGISFRLMKYDSQQVIDKLLGREIDFGIVGSLTKHPYLEYIKIFEDEVVFVGHHDFQSPSSIRLEQLQALPIILREVGSGTRKAVENRLAKFGLSVLDLNIKAVIGDNQTIKEFVMQRLGYAFVSNLAVHQELSQGLLRSIRVEDLSIQRDFYFVYHTRRVLSPLAEKFKDYLLQQITAESGGECEQD